jgi:AraC family transcriptional regulator, activator of mtrCDE
VAQIVPFPRRLPIERQLIHCRRAMPTQLLPRKPAAHLDQLMTAFEVDFVRLTECLVSPGWSLKLEAADHPAIHYNLTGMGRMRIGREISITLAPHTLVILPRGTAFTLEALILDEPVNEDAVVESKWTPAVAHQLRRLVAGTTPPEIILICGYFRASFGAFIDLFGNLSAPIVESFGAADQLDTKLKAALAELISQEVGSGAMSMAIVKQVLITVLRRSLLCDDLWVERFAAWSDPPIARAFSQMVTDPGAPHTVHTLAKSSHLSRSAFMARFSAAFGTSPIAVLRQLRMRHAMILLKGNTLSIDRIANAVGYAGRSSFYRAFRQVYAADPSDYRTEARSRLKPRRDR